MSTSSLLVVDGDCGICTVAGRWIAQRARNVSVVTHIDMDMAPLDKVLYRDDQGRYEGAAAVSRVLKASDVVLLRVAGVVISLPVVSVVARLVYALVARNRSRLSRAFGLRACTIGDKSRVSEPRRSAEASSDAATSV